MRQSITFINLSIVGYRNID